VSQLQKALRAVRAEMFVEVAAARQHGADRARGLDHRRAEGTDDFDGRDERWPRTLFGEPSSPLSSPPRADQQRWQHARGGGPGCNPPFLRGTPLRPPWALEHDTDPRPHDTITDEVVGTHSPAAEQENEAAGQPSGDDVSIVEAEKEEEEEDDDDDDDYVDVDEDAEGKSEFLSGIESGSDSGSDASGVLARRCEEVSDGPRHSVSMNRCASRRHGGCEPTPSVVDRRWHLRIERGRTATDVVGSPSGPCMGTAEVTALGAATRGQSRPQMTVVTVRRPGERRRDQVLVWG
jgi:hypothetical protein